MKFVITVEVEVERTEGKFASRDEILDEILSSVEGADPGSISGENGGEYEVVVWEASEVVK